MSTTGQKTERDTKLTELIRQQIGTQANRRHLARLPEFTLQDEMPERLGLLLARLDEAEHGRAGDDLIAPETPAAAQSGHHWPASAHGRNQE